MNKKYFLLLFSFILIMSLFLVACGEGNSSSSEKSVPENTSEISSATGESGSEQQSTENPYTIRIAHGVATTTIRHKSFEQFEQALEEKTDGQVQVDIYPAGQLVGDKDSVEAAIRGTVELVIQPVSELASIDPRFNLPSLPNLFPTPGDIFRFENSNELMDLFSIAEDAGLVPIGMYTFSPSYMFTSSKTRLDSPEGFKGQQLRVPGSPFFLAVAEALGVSPVSIEVSEVQSALQQGVVDGVFTSVATGLGMNLWETQKYAVAGPVIGTSSGLMVINKKFYESLPQDVKDAIDEAYVESRKWNMDQVLKEEEQGVKTYRENGMTFDYLPEQPELIPPFEKALQSATEKLTADIPEDVMDLFEQALDGTPRPGLD